MIPQPGIVPAAEVERRLGALQRSLADRSLAAAVIVQAADMYYLCGTVQDAHLLVPASGEPALCVRRSLERARDESPLERIGPLRSLSQLGAALADLGVRGGALGLELDVLPTVTY